MANKFKNQRQKNYLARDFDGFRAQLIEYARIFFPDKIQDFSEASMGGLLVDLAAIVGDTMSFYLDHQFNELNFARATELPNIETHLRNAGVTVRGKAPASTTVDVTITVDAVSFAGQYSPDTNQLPKIFTGTEFIAKNGTKFVTVQDIDYADVDFLGQLLGSTVIATTNSDGSPATFDVIRNIQVSAGRLVTETFVLSNKYVPFKTITLNNGDVSVIRSVTDASENDYYEVDDLSQDTVFRRVSTQAPIDSSKASASLEVIPAPYRFTVSTSLKTRLTTIRFGSGNGKSVQDDVISDPSELALPLVGTTTFKKFSIDPNDLLRSNSLGVSPTGTTITIEYMCGGGLNTNVGSGAINQLSTLSILFPASATTTQIASVKAGLKVTNLTPATGGDDALSIEDLRAKIPSAQNAQNRIVTREDLLARVYTLPDTFGRVYRAGVTPSIDNTLSSDLSIICRDSDGHLAAASDTLKLNLRNYLNEFRLISESIHVKDASVINFGIEFTIRVRPNANKIATVQRVINNLRSLLDVSRFQVGEPIVESNITLAILNTQGVQALPSLKFINFFGLIGDISYSSEIFDLNENMLNGLVVPPASCIFELKFPNTDILGNVL